MNSRVKEEHSYSPRCLEIAGCSIGDSCPPYVIGELSANHNGDLACALKLIEVAQAAGVSAVKLQTYRPDTITIDCAEEDFSIGEGLWKGRSLYELYEEAHTPWEWHPELFAKARALGVTLFSSPFDTTAVDFLEDLEAPAYKIASFEMIDLPLVRYAASTGKPLIVSTGMASLEEIAETVEVLRETGCEDFVLLRCVSGYPAPAEDYNLRSLPFLREKFNCLVGLSDHTLSNATAVASVALGACVIEKHFTLDRQRGGPDDSFSLEPSELSALCTDARVAYEALGRVHFGRKSSELSNVKFRRSLYAVENVAAGEPLTAANVRSIRPGFGLAPKHLPAVLGRRAAHDLKRGTALNWGLLLDE